jgi:CP family cyanate transporter-like MFS transporter
VQSSVDRQPWAGRIAALVGILLVALNLRTAVAAISPIVAEISGEVALTSVGLGLLGSLPPIAFAVCGLVAPLVARRIGLEATLVLACVAMIVGPVLRVVDGYPALVGGGVVALAGMGFGNVLLPPAVKKYFPDRIGIVTSGYVPLVSLSAAIPAILAAPIAATAGWRVSVASWAVLAVLALVPWLVEWARARRERQRSETVIAAPPARLLSRMWRSRTAWAIMVAFAMSSISFYGMFAWLPELLIESAGLEPVQAGALLSLYGAVGIPLAFAVPALAARMRNVGSLILAGTAVLLVGYAGLIVAPAAATWLWVLLSGVGTVLFPICLVLINLRTRSPDASAALSGFVQSVGYAVGALGPFVLGLLHDLTRAWALPLVFLGATSLVAVWSAIVLSRPIFVEDEIGENR